jgi:hypothetical protein
MATVDVYVPLVMNRGYGFFGEGVPETTLFGYRTTMVGSAPTVGQTETIQGLCFHGVEEENVGELVTRVRALLIWASVALNKTIRTDDAAPQKSDSGTYDGRTTYYYPSGLVPRPITAWGSVYGAEAFSKLIDAVAEGDRRAGLDRLRLMPPRLRSAFDFYMAADFEASENAAFVMLTASLEVLATSSHPDPCAEMVGKWQEMAAMAAMAARSTGESELANSFDEVARQVSHLKHRSIRGSIRRLVAKCAEAMGREDSADLGTKAAKLYDKRSDLVHQAKNVPDSDVAELRSIVRIVLEAHALGKVTAPNATT